MQGEKGVHGKKAGPGYLISTVQRFFIHVYSPTVMDFWGYVLIELFQWQALLLNKRKKFLWGNILCLPVLH